MYLYIIFIGVACSNSHILLLSELYVVYSGYQIIFYLILLYYWPSFLFLINKTMVMNLPFLFAQGNSSSGAGFGFNQSTHCKGHGYMYDGRVQLLRSHASKDVNHST